MVRDAFYMAIVGVLVCAAPLRAAFAQATTVDAGSLSVDAGTTATVPISIVLPAEKTAATLQFNLTVVPGSGAPALTTQITFTNSTSNPTSQNAANGLSTRLIGWFSNFDPLLTGTVALGTLSVPIPAGAEGKTYTVQVIAPSGTADVDNTIDIDPISGVNGTITVNGGGPVGTTVNAGNASADAGAVATVPISIVLPAEQTAATLRFNLTVVPGSGAPVLTEQVTFTNSTSNPTSQNAANGLSTRLIGWFSNFDPLLTGTVALGTLSVPIPADAGGKTYTVQVIAPSGTADVDNTIDIDPISGVNGTITVGGVPPPPSATPTNTPPTPATPTPTSTPPTPPTPTATAASPTATRTSVATATRTSAGGASPTPGACPTCEDDDGCQIGTTGHSSAWLLLIPAIGLLVVRRRRR